MTTKKESKGELHPRNRDRGRYDLTKLSLANPELTQYITTNKVGEPTISFFDPKAVKALNKALLASHYGITYWDLPSTSLVPPIPGRADYIHYIADIIGTGKKRCLDIGVGANCIYPTIGVCEYGWEFVGSDISETSLTNAAKIIENNEVLKGHIELRLQPDSRSIFRGVIRENDQFDITICNPPFHDSAKSAMEGTMRKIKNLKGEKRRPQRTDLNFSGEANELWCEGGEIGFITQMIRESRLFKANCRYFSTLVSKESNLPRLRCEIGLIGAAKHQIIEMSQGNKRSRILLWKF